MSSFNFSWKIGGNWFICRKCFLLFRVWLGISKWCKTLSVLCYQIYIRKRSVLEMMFLYWIICKYWNIFCGFHRYTTRNVTTMLRQLASICIILRRCGCWYTMLILLTVTIFCGWMKWPLLFSTIILSGTGSWPWTPIMFWTIFRNKVLLTVYKQTIIYLQ